MKSSDQAVLERARTAMQDERSSAGAIKSILFHVHDDGGLDARLQTAVSIARACSAHLECLQFIPLEAFAKVDAYGMLINSEALAMLEEQAAKLRSRIEGRLRQQDVAWS